MNWCTCQGVNKFLAPLPRILHFFVLSCYIFQFGSNYSLFFDFFNSILIVNLILCLGELLHSCLLLVCKVKLQWRTQPHKTWRLKRLVEGTTRPEEEESYRRGQLTKVIKEFHPLNHLSSFPVNLEELVLSTFQATITIEDRLPRVTLEDYLSFSTPQFFTSIA